MDIQLDRLIDEQEEKYMIDRQLNGQIYPDRQIDGWIDGYIDIWIDRGKVIQIDRVHI